MKLVGLYLHRHRRGLFLFAAFSAVFFLVFFLYGLPVSAVAYAASLCLAIGLAVMAPDFRAFVRRHRRLERLREEILLSCDHLPAPDGTLEGDYQEIIRSLYRDRQEQLDRRDALYADLVDSYTVWAHQIKTPIASMRLNLQGEDSPRSRELSDDLLRIEQYVEMALAVLRLDSRSTDYVIRSAGLDGIVRQAVRRYAPLFIRRKIRLEYTPPDSRVLTDEKWLLFVIEQLLSNALKYTGPGGTVAIGEEAPQILRIRDTGIGIAPEDLPRVFEKGYTGGNGRTDKKASGLGLYLCRRVCDSLGHRLRVVSAVGGGTVVYLDLREAALEIE
ncbi:MAG TPA: sensor histidine kinase [Firmicutes bacterium]|nr:sensor histidine kinase [Bacillota bacterium]